MPTTSSLASSGPKLGTGALNQSGFAAAFSARYAASRGQSAQSGAGVSSVTAWVRTWVTGAIGSVL
jgi:hypothetical protein